MCPAKVDVPLVVDTVMVTHRIHFDQLAAVLGVDKEQVRMLNPQYRRDIIPGDLKPYALRLPLPYATAYVEQCDSVRAYKADELINNRRKEIEIYRSSAPGGSGKLIYHKVKSGGDLWAYRHPLRHYRLENPPVEQHLRLAHLCRAAVEDIQIEAWRYGKALLLDIRGGGHVQGESVAPAFPGEAVSPA